MVSRIFLQYLYDTRTVTEIQNAILKKRKRWKFLKLVHAKIDAQTLHKHPEVGSRQSPGFV